MPSPLSRRDILKLIASASAAFAVPACARGPGAAEGPLSQGDAATADAGASAAALPMTADVVVIGAGMAGISAASALRDQESVIVLEGRDRIGGRMHTDHSWGFPADLGASWIHGVTGNPITDLAAKYGVATRKTDWDSRVFFDSDGQRRTDLEALEVALQGFLDAAAADAEASETDTPLSLPLWQRIDATNPTPARVIDLRAALHLDVESDFAAEASELSAKWWNEGNVEVGGDTLVVGGYDKVIGGLAAGLDVRLGQIVSRVKHTPGHVEVTTTAGVVTARMCVVTLPLGVLKKGTVVFEPDLPQPKRDAIARLGMGLLNKVLLRFPEAFWSDDTDWILRAPAKKGEWTPVLDFQHIVGRPVLLCFTAGDFARETEALSDEATVAGLMGALRTCYGAGIPEPVASIVTRWSADPFAFGSYSHIPPGSSPANRRLLGLDVDKTLFFAGEATDLGASATVRGAHSSGQRVAQEIARG